jgi:Tol biopolymer transport system component
VQRLLAIVLLVLSAGSLRAQESFPHTELDWFSIESTHFVVHYHTGARRTAEEVSRIAEAVYRPVTEMYGHEPDQKVNFVIRDHDDYSNGAAYFFDNKIEILAPSLDFELRGTHPWLWNVVTHEFTHMIQIQTSLKFGRRLPAIYVQWLGYEEERRPDVLYGYPNVLVSYPISGFVVPSWFAEGTAQYNVPDLQFDYWDTHRDMILRMYMLAGKPLTWEEMAVFGKTSLGNESSYNAGFSLVSYIAEKYGADKLRAISRRLAAPFRVTIDGAIEDVIGITGEQLYDQWKQDKAVFYGKASREIAASRREGKTIEADGFGNGYPAFSPDNRTLAYVSNKGEDYFGRSSLYFYDVPTGTSRKVVDQVRSSISFSPNGQALFYAKSSRDNPHWSMLNDLYRFDLGSEEETRLTFGLRAASPALSPDGRRLAFAFGSDGTMNLGVADADGKAVGALTAFVNGEQVYTPTWSPDGSTIAFGYSVGHNQRLVLVDSSGSAMRFLKISGDARNPVFSPDGRYLYFSWDSTGVFNIYRMDRRTERVTRVTNVLGGAFQPAVSRTGQVAYASYTETGYKLALIADTLASDEDGTTAPILDGVPPEAGRTSAAVGDTTKSRPYRTTFTSMSFIPVLRFDNYNEKGSGLDRIKPGLYITSGDMLEKMSLFAGAAINRQYERDIFVSLEYQDRLPLFSWIGLEPKATLELYSVSRKADVSFMLDAVRNGLSRDQTIRTDVTYDLLEFDFSLTQPLFSSKSVLQATYSKSRYSASLGYFSFYDAFRGAIESKGSRLTYLINDILSVRWKFDGIESTRDKDINPIGRAVSLKYSYEWNQYNRDLNYDYSSGIPVPLYIKEYFHRIEFSWNEHLRLPFDGHTLTLGFGGGTIQGMTADTIFNFYAGGFIGMRGYPFYAIEGNHVATASINYRFPLWTAINTRIFQMYFTKLYGSIFADIGDAWNGPAPRIGAWKTDAGAELRLEAFSFYAFPTRIFFAGAYGFDQFTRHIQGTNVTYGKEWRFYLGILFGFELNDIAPRAWRMGHGN